MASAPSVSFAKLSTEPKGCAVILSLDGALSEAAQALDPAGVVERAARTADFKGKFGRALDILAPQSGDLDRLVVIGAGKASALDEHAWLKLGGAVAAQFRNAREITLLLDLPEVEIGAEQAAAVACGILLRSYTFDKYKTRKDDEAASEPVSVTILCADPSAAKKAFAAQGGIIDGVLLARDLVNEPANVLGTLEFVEKAEKLEKLGVKVEVLTEKDMRKLGMGALLGVAQGSSRPPRLVVMQWNGAKSKEAPVAFVGKGVVFDSGGISIKQAGGMEDMKGDMGGAAAVTGLMHALAARKAKVNAIGVIALVENMLDANAQRPGDIVTSMSGQTIEVLNTDAEGRLVLADALWYTNDRFKPKFMINLATLTGAIIVALGNAHAGLFSNDDELVERLTAAGLVTQEKLWRMPMGGDYEKLIESKNADMKNTGGRYGGSIAAAQFLKRFVKDTPWAHLDIAGTAMGSPSSDINQSWASGFGVRLLDRLVRDHYEG